MMKNKIAFILVLCFLYPFQIAASAAEGDIPASEVATALTEGAFTPDGNGTVLDNYFETDGKEFFTFVTPAGNVFYLVIDRLRPQDNVYFLNGVTENDLMALAEKDGVSIQAGTTAPEAGTDPKKPDEKKDPAPKEKSEGGADTNTIIFVGIAAVVAFGAAFFMKKRKGKTPAPDAGDDPEEPEESFDDEDESDGFGGGFGDVGDDFEDRG